jgi:hypothetical protein
MGPVYAEAEIDVPREVLFDYLMDYSTRPVVFGEDLTGFRLVGFEAVGIGAGARFRLGKHGSWLGMSITDAEGPVRISERGSTGRGNMTPAGFEWEFEVTPAGPTAVRLSYWTEVEGAAAVPDRFTGRAGWHTRLLKSALGRLRVQVEEGRFGREDLTVAGGNRFETGVP